MKVGVNARFLTKPFSGIGNYTRSVFMALAKQNPHDKFILVAPQPCDLPMPKNVEIVALPEKFPGTSGMKKTFWEQVQVPRFFLKQKVDLAHFPYPCNPWFGFKKPVVVTVHDVIPWVLPAYRKSFSTRIYQDRCKNAVKKANIILTVSEASKKEISKICRVPLEKIFVTYNATARDFLIKAPSSESKNILDKYGIDQQIPYFLYVGGYDDRKNVRMIIDVFLDKIAPNHRINLVLAGGKTLNANLYESFDYLTKCQRGVSLQAQEGKIKVTGFVDELDLPVLYQSSFAFLNLSKMEGFNLPLVEAAVSGVPVIASDIPVHREIAGSYALFTNPDDGNALGDLMKKLITDSDFYQEAKSKINKYKCPYSWEKTAEEINRIYKKLI
jgi:glycosyltransferase involved in cell wall biosynthesis